MGFDQLSQSSFKFASNAILLWAHDQRFDDSIRLSKSRFADPAGEARNLKVFQDFDVAINEVGVSPRTFWSFGHASRHLLDCSEAMSCYINFVIVFIGLVLTVF